MLYKWSNHLLKICMVLRYLGVTIETDRQAIGVDRFHSFPLKMWYIMTKSISASDDCCDFGVLIRNQMYPFYCFSC